jgi:ribosomal protein S17
MKLNVVFLKKGKLYQAAYDFNAEDDSELSMKRGDVVRVTETSDPNWWTGKYTLIFILKFKILIYINFKS